MRGGSLSSSYDLILRDYLFQGTEADLYSALNFGKVCVDEEVSPEELVGLHLSSLRKIIKELPKEQVAEMVLKSLDLLVEVMVAYGMNYKEHLDLKLERHWLEQELKIARKIQQSIIPKRVPIMEKLDIAVKMSPARYIGGDYYQFFSPSPDFLSLWIGDVSGKSIPAALLVSMLKYALENHLTVGSLKPTNNFISRVNNTVCEDIDPEAFISLFYAYFDLESYMLLYSNAGHELPLLLRDNSDDCLHLNTDGIVLGVSKLVTFEERQIELRKKDLVVFYTDGVTDIVNNDGESFGLSRLEETLKEFRHLKASQIVNHIFNTAANFCQMRFHDDVTLIVIKVR